MTFDLHQLDNLDFDDSNELVDDYIQDAIQAFADSPEGQAYSERASRLWRLDQGSFIDFSYNYEGFTLPKMTEANVDLGNGFSFAPQKSP